VRFELTEALADSTIQLSPLPDIPSISENQKNARNFLALGVVLPNGIILGQVFFVIRELGRLNP